MTPFSSVERALKEIIEAGYPAAAGHVGGDLSYSGEPLYVMISLVPGGGVTDQITGEWAVDLDFFAPTYGAALDHALAIEALLLSGPHRSSAMLVDSVYENSAPAEMPWDDDGSARLGATFVLSARRTG